MARSPASVDEIRRPGDAEGFAVPADLAINGASVFNALLHVDPVRPPSGDSMTGHLWLLADQLRT
eukprot:7109374-Pyramimonas_sp.AAC.1